MPNSRETVALAAVGDLGKYVCEELLRNGQYETVVLCRQPRQWFADHGISTMLTDYSEDSVLSILDTCEATVLVSFLNYGNTEYINIHTCFLNACRRSLKCKRLIPSEWAGNIDDFPMLPPFYGETREPFRRLLRQTSDIQWTLINGGWLMDYFMLPEKSHMTPVGDEFPINSQRWTANIRGTGDEQQTWTCARDVAKAVVALFSARHWDPVTYVAGEWSTFNEAIKTMEKVSGRPLAVSHKSREESQDDGSYLDEWMLCGAAACPRQKTLRQRDEFFWGLHFRTLEELLKEAATSQFI